MIGYFGFGHLPQGSAQGSGLVRMSITRCTAAFLVGILALFASGCAEGLSGIDSPPMRRAMDSFYKKVEDLFEHAKSELRPREVMPSSSGPLDGDTNPKPVKGEELPNPVVSQVSADVRSVIEKRAVNGRIQFQGSPIAVQEVEPVVERHITFMIGSVVCRYHLARRPSSHKSGMSL
jgi:hypothetical protein